jgi:hypothetical protein
VRSIAPLVPNNGEPGPAVPISVPVKRRARPSTRPVLPPASAPTQIPAETQLGDGLHEDVLLALLRHAIADR